MGLAHIKSTFNMHVSKPKSIYKVPFLEFLVSYFYHYSRRIYPTSLDSNDARNPYIHRLIASSSKCLTKPLSVPLTKLLTLNIKQGLHHTSWMTCYLLLKLTVLSRSAIVVKSTFLVAFVFVLWFSNFL